MPEGQIKVSFGELQSAAGSISNNASQIQSSLDDLKQFLAPLVSGWEGTAAETYNAHQQKWDTAAADLRQVLAAIGTAVAQAADDYQMGEQQNIARW
jgi:early secretory antigenic target protein ESAT-6